MFRRHPGLSGEITVWIVSAETDTIRMQCRTFVGKRFHARGAHGCNTLRIQFEHGVHAG